MVTFQGESQNNGVFMSRLRLTCWSEESSVFQQGHLAVSLGGVGDNLTIMI